MIFPLSIPSQLFGQHLKALIFCGLYSCPLSQALRFLTTQKQPVPHALRQCLFTSCNDLDALHGNDSFDPLNSFLPLPENGLGMNTLLQNPYMVITSSSFYRLHFLQLLLPTQLQPLHTVMLLKVGFKTVRRWTLVAWSFLTIGIFLGGRWAYVELGWAGYWAWDPVENSSLIPWLFTTSLLHALIVQGKIGHLKKQV